MSAITNCSRCLNPEVGSPWEGLQSWIMRMGSFPLISNLEHQCARPDSGQTKILLHMPRAINLGRSLPREIRSYRFHLPVFQAAGASPRGYLQLSSQILTCWNPERQLVIPEVISGIWLFTIFFKKKECSNSFPKPAVWEWKRFVSGDLK